jgi:hypothetical protein
MFQAIGLPVYMFSTEQLNKTTFGSHNSAQILDADSDDRGASGDTVPHTLFSKSQKVDFFAPGWWERELLWVCLFNLNSILFRRCYVGCGHRLC